MLRICEAAADSARAPCTQQTRICGAYARSLWRSRHSPLHPQPKEMLRASADYYLAPWFDTVSAKHQAVERGAGRRLPSDRSHRERRGKEVGLGPGEVLDPAQIQGLYWCQVPEGQPREGEVVPFLHVKWMRHFDCWARFDVPEGDRAAMQRCKAILDDWGVEGVQLDPHEYPYMMQPSEVAGIQYLQHGYYGQRAGEPDFFFTDTMWDKLK